MGEQAKILLYTLNFAPEPVGVGKYSTELASWLVAKGYQVRVVTAPPYFPGWSIFSGYPNRFSLESNVGLSVQRCPIWVPSNPNGLTRILHLASFALSSFLPVLFQRAWHPDVVISVAPTFFCTPAALMLGHLCGRHTIQWLHMQDLELDAAFELGIIRSRLLRTITQAWERRTLSGFTRVSSISSAMLQRIEAKGVSPAHTVLLPNWVDLQLIRPQPAKSRNTNSYRRDLGIGQDQLVLMYSGSMNQKQGLDLLVDVIHQLMDLPQLVWLLAGEGPSKADTIMRTKNLPHVVHLPLQPLEKLNEWLNAADIHLLPQKHEVADLVLPSKLLGMLASGRPVVACSPPRSELYNLAQASGACVPPGNASAFADALRELINSSERREHAGRQARYLAEQCFGIDSVLGCFDQQLRSLIKEHRAFASNRRY